MTSRLKTNQLWRDRAVRVIPGGMYGHQNTRLMPDAYPQFFAKAKGCHLWDVDGNEYIDLMSSYGPIILGHQHAGVDAAAREQLSRGDCMNGPAPVMVELAELLVERVQHADWAMFQKNGTDATTLSVSIARQATGKRKIMLATGAYHGAAPWCTPLNAGTVEEDRVHLINYRYNDLASVDQAVAEAGDDLAAILVSAFKHDAFVELELPSRDFASHLRQICDRKGAVLILDDVRAGFRLTEGASWERLDIQPDLSAWSKAIANGYPLAAVLGSDSLMRSARSIFSTGSFWFAASAMAAAMATIQAIRSEAIIERMQELGEIFRQGIAEQARSHGVAISQSGPVQMPLVLFDDDTGRQKERGNCWTSAAMHSGLYLHPWHNMFFNGAHQRDDIERALEITDSAFKVVADQFS